MTINALPVIVVLLLAPVMARWAVMRRSQRATGAARPAQPLPDPFAQVLTDVALLVAIIDVNGCIAFANERLAQLTGWPREQLVGRDWDATFGSGLVVHRRRLATLAAGTAATEVENVLVTRSGEHRVVSWNDTVTVDAHGQVTGIGRIGADVTTRRHAEDRIAFLAHYDELTGLPNRALFHDWVDLALRESARYSRTAAVL